MNLGGRIGKLEAMFGPELDVRPRLLSVVEDDAGLWRLNGEPVEREAIEARRPRLLRVYRIVEDAEGKEPA